MPLNIDEQWLPVLPGLLAMNQLDNMHMHGNMALQWSLQEGLSFPKRSSPPRSPPPNIYPRPLFSKPGHLCSNMQAVNNFADWEPFWRCIGRASQRVSWLLYWRTLSCCNHLALALHSAGCLCNRETFLNTVVVIIGSHHWLGHIILLGLSFFIASTEDEAIKAFPTAAFSQ